MPIEPQPITALPEAQAILGRHERGEGGDHGRIPSNSIHEGPVVRRSPKPDRAAGPINQKVTHRHQMVADLLTLSKSQNTF